MSNIVIASSNALCQSAKNWFLKNQNCIEGPPIDTVGNGETIYIIAHDSELGDGSALISYLENYNMPMQNFQIVLIVCSAASMQFEKELLTPAERIANYFHRDVYASKSLVYGTWEDSKGATFTGDYITVPPNTDINSLMKNLKI